MPVARIQISIRGKHVFQSLRRLHCCRGYNQPIAPIWRAPASTGISHFQGKLTAFGHLDCWEGLAPRVHVAAVGLANIEATRRFQH